MMRPARQTAKGRVGTGQADVRFSDRDTAQR